MSDIHYSPPATRNRRAITGPTACGVVADGQHITFQEHKATCKDCSMKCSHCNRTVKLNQIVRSPHRDLGCVYCYKSTEVR